MSIETINYLLAKYYEGLTSLQYLYQNELNKPSAYQSDVKPSDEYKIQIDFLKKLINDLESLKTNLEDFRI